MRHSEAGDVGLVFLVSHEFPFFLYVDCNSASVDGCINFLSRSISAFKLSICRQISESGSANIARNISSSSSSFVSIFFSVLVKVSFVGYIYL